MKVNYKTRNGRMMFEIVAENIKDVFRQVSEIQEIFEMDTAHGDCAGDNTRLRVRHIDGFDFYEIHCDECGGNLALGQRRDDNGLFPKFKDQDGQWFPNGGFVVFNKESQAN